MPYPGFKYPQPQPYSSSYSTLKDWDREQSSKTGSSRTRGFPYIEQLSSSYTLANIRDQWKTPGENAAGPGLSTHIPTFDDTFGWYGAEDESSPTSSVPVHQFPGRLNTSSNKAFSATTSGSGSVSENYAFFSTNVI